MEERDIIVKETPVGDRYVLAALDKDGLSPRGRAVRPHHLPAPGHHRRRPADRTDPGRSGGPAGKPLAEQLDGLVTRVPQVLVNVPVPNTELLDGADAVWSAVAEEEARLGDAGRVLLRPSGTEPLVRVMVEASGEGVAEAIAERLGTLVSFELQAAAATHG